MVRRTRAYTPPQQMSEPPAPAYMLRRKDINAMIKDGTIDSQHFLIRALADGVRLSEDGKTV